MADSPFGLFERYGVELEYMIVRVAEAEAEAGAFAFRDLSVAPIADRLLAPEGGEPESEIRVGDVAWSNELVLHVLELKTPDGPAASFDGLIDAFQAGVNEANVRLEAYGARLLPGGMHPLMDPLTETRLWPHEYGAVYRAFDQVFDCRGHGWSNLQSTHLNLPFADDDEFGRLHAAIRFVLPLLPALAASSPVVEGRVAPWLDARMAFYRDNARRVPSVSGVVVPEPARTEQEYRDRILAPIFADLAPHDPEGTLRHEWVNARGAIARFERGAIEIRVLDVQECPLADIAMLAAITSVVRALCEERTAPTSSLDAIGTERLSGILQETIVAGDGATIADLEYLRLLGIESDAPLAAGGVWMRLIEQFPPEGEDADRWHAALGVMLGEGCLARRIRRELGERPEPLRIRAVYGELAECLADGRMFTGKRGRRER